MKIKVFAIPAVIVLALIGTRIEADAYAMNPDNGHRYEVFFGGYSWDEANAAVAPGYHLATITDAAEQEFVMGLLTGLTGEFWLGAYQDPNESVADAGWSWVTGESWEYTNWQPAEPNDYMGLQEMHLGIWSNFDWRWNDEHNRSNIRGYLVESAAPVPEPATLLLLGTGLLGAGFGLQRRRKTR